MSRAKRLLESFNEINFSPFASNVLDYVGREDLCTVGGAKVTIKRPGMSFEISIEGESKYVTDSNLDASSYLNRKQVGIRG